MTDTPATKPKRTFKQRWASFVEATGVVGVFCAFGLGFGLFYVACLLPNAVFKLIFGACW